jgi:bifunctional non-homologous end joining protein LigD
VSPVIFLQSREERQSGERGRRGAIWTGDITVNRWLSLICRGNCYSTRGNGTATAKIFEYTCGVKILQEYRRKRDFAKTSEPVGKKEPVARQRFVIQKHAARRLHYDLRLELGGVMKSWAVPKGPSLNPVDKRLAIEVEDHPLSYRDFEGTIPKGNYGAGEVIVWDTGTYETEGSDSASEQYRRGEWKFRLFGKKLRGGFVLVRLRRSADKKEWLLIKHRDDEARTDWDVEEHPESALSSRTLPGPPVARKAVRADRAMPEGAVRAEFPGKMPVTLAELGRKPFSDPNWVFEVKWDGVRVLAYVEGSSVKVSARSGRDITNEFPEMKKLAGQLNANSAVLDGEVVALDGHGRSEFQRLQERLGVQNPSAALRAKVPINCYFFDLLYLQGYDVRKVPLLERKELLKQSLVTNEVFRYSEHEREQGEALFGAAKKQGLEGIIGKKIDSLYSGRRTSDWVKLKVVNELDAVVGGWTDPRRSRKYFGALVLGLYEGKELKFIGSAGTGFDEREQRRVHQELKAIASDPCPFRAVPRLKEPVHWVRPEMVARIKFGNWTHGEHLRMPVLLGIRKDREAKECTFESAKSVPVEPPHSRVRAEPAARQLKTGTRSAEAGADDAHGLTGKILASKSADLFVEIHEHSVHLTNLSKIYFPKPKISKGELLAYYAGMARYILPFLRERPLVLRRYPNGVDGKSFFQKEAPQGLPEWVETASVYSDERKAKMDYVMADDLESLLYLTNLGCIDHNPWSSRANNQDSPDYLFFDLDPTPPTPYTTILDIARAIHVMLTKIGLRCFLKTSGATGFHIFVPLKPGYRYADTRSFAEIVTKSLDAKVLAHVTMERTVSHRQRGKVMIDALQNARGKPLACAYSVRATQGATVSTPITEKELRGGFDPTQWTLKTVPRRVARIGDLWGDLFHVEQSLEEPLDKLYAIAKKKGER